MVAMDSGRGVKYFVSHLGELGEGGSNMLGPSYKLGMLVMAKSV